ncbi:MAG: hypothetical protein COA49_03320 [Bacteroidetes bacterium]|nr:MAG: hypothetical protein COA49_03320 [Bacteroidota bacterium]
MEWAHYINDLSAIGFGLTIEAWVGIVLSFLLFNALFVNLTSKTINSQESLHFITSLQSIKLTSYLLFIVLLCANVVFIFFYQEFIVDENFALDLIVVIALISSTLLIKLFNHTKGRDNINTFIRPQLSLIKKAQVTRLLISKFQKAKLFILVLLTLPFVVLLMQSITETKAEVSILIDNSGSTDESINESRNYLAQAMRTTVDNTTFNISYFPNYNENQCERYIRKLKKDVNEVISELRHENLLGVNYHFSNTGAATSFIQNTPIETSCLGSPLIETIWANFLFTTDKENLVTKDKKIFIIITDGAGNLYSETSPTKVPNGFDIFTIVETTSQQSMEDYYNDISIINIGDLYDQYLFEEIKQSSVELLDGYDKESYVNSLLYAIKNIQKRNWCFIYVISFIVILTCVLVFMSSINPKFESKN